MALNRIYKVVWSKTKGCYIVVSELAKRVGRNKAKAIVISSAAMAMAVSSVVTSTVGAANTVNADGTGGDNAVAWGTGSTAAGGGAVALGKTATASASGAVALGEGTKAAHNNGVAIGKKAESTKDSAIALGFESKSTGDQSVAIGMQTKATNNQAVAVGSKSQASGQGAVALGTETKAENNNGVAIGKKAKSTGDSAIALGLESNSTGKWSVAVGLGTNASGNQVVAVGSKSQATGENSIAIGNAANASNESSVALGSSTTSTNKFTTAVGGTAFANQEGATALGYGARATAKDTIAIGNSAKAEKVGVLALGAESKAQEDDTIAIGNSATAKQTGDIIIGKEAKSRDQGGGRSVAIGFKAIAGSDRNKHEENDASTGERADDGSVAIGTNAYTGLNKGNTAVNNSVAIGAGAGVGYRSVRTDGKPLGVGTDADDNDKVLVKAFGGTTSTLVYFTNAGAANNDKFFSFQNVAINEGTALGRNTRAIGDQSVAIGAQSIAGMGSIVIGGNDIQAYDGKKYFKAADPNSADARSVNDFNAAVTPGTGKKNPTDKTESELTISEKYKELVGAGLDRSYRASYGQDGSTVIGMQAHSTTPLGVAIGTNSIVRKGAFGATAIGSGASVVANAEAAVAIGMGSEAQGNYAVAAGTAARAKEAAVAAGYRSNAETSAVAVGDHAQATKASVAVGQLAQATKEADIAVGQGAVASGEQGAIAVGLGTQAQGDSSIMIGGSEITRVSKQTVSYQKEKIGTDGKAVIKTEKKTEMIGGVPTDRTVRSVVMENASGTIQQAYGELTNGGILNTATLDYSSAANRNGHGSISMGVHSLSTGDLGTAIGTGARVTKLGGVALGTGAMSELQNGVAIGTGSRADSRSIGTRQTDISYDEEGHIVPFDSKKVAYTFYWAGGSNTSEGDVVSFGSPGAERQLKNVAAGRIADDSTDAINGSQLNSVTKRMSNGWSVEAEKDKTSSGVLKLNGALATKGSEVHSENGKTTTRENPGTATGNVDKIRLNDEVKIRVGDNLVLHQEDASRPVYEDPDHPERQTGTRVTSKFTYSLNPELTGLKSAQFKNDAGDTTDINGAGVTVTPVTAGKQPVSLTTAGLNNGGNAISNVAGNLPSTKNNDATTGASNATTSQAAPALGNAANQVNPTNAATVSDVLNAGWNLQGNNKAVDFVKPYDTVNFINGEGTTADVESKDGKTSTVKYSVNLGDGLKKDDATNKITVTAADKSLTVGTDGVKVNPGDKSLTTTNTGLTVNTADKSLEVTNDGLKVKTDGTTITTDDTNGLKVVTGAIEPVKTGADSGTVKVKDGDKGKIATVDSVVNAVNSAAFTLKASAAGGTRNAGSGITTDGESIKAGSTIEMIAGKNLDVKHDASGKITFATVDTPSFTTVQVGGDQGPKLSKTNDGDLKVSGSNGTDPVKVTNVKSGLDTYGGNVAGTTNKNTGLVDLSKPTAGEPKVSDNTAATVGDIRNMGWIVSSNKTTGADGAVTDTEYSSTVKNANEVRFVGTGSAIVSGKTDGDVRTITVKVDDQTSSNNAVTPVVYTDNDGNRVYPTGETDKDGNQIFNTKPDGKGKAVTGPVKTTVNGPKGTSAPTTLSNVEGNLVGAKTGTNAPTTSATAPTLGTGTDQVNKNNAATVGDVLNAGWNLQNNDAAKDFVKPYDTVNFVNGEGTTAVVETTTDQATSKIKYNVNTGNGLEKTTDNKITVKPGDKSLEVTDAGVAVKKADQSLEVTDDGLKVKTDNKTITTGKDGLTVKTGTVNTVEQGDKKGTVEVPTADAGKIATVDTVAKAVNNAAFTLKTSANGGTRNAGSGIGETGELIKAGSTIEMIAGKNLDVKHDASGKITFATVESPSFNTIQVGGDQGPKLSKTDDGNIKVSDKDGTNPVNITNVKSNLPDTQNSDTTNTATNPSNATTSKAAPNTTNKTGDSYINPNNAATVSDVLNAGWNLQGNGSAVDFVKPYDTVNFVNGVNTTAVVSTVDGKTSNVTYNVTGLPITYTDKDGNLVSKIGDEFYKVNDKGQPLDAKGNPSTKVNKDGKPVDDAGNVIDPINTTNNPVKTSLVNPAPEANKTGTTSPTTLDNVTSKLENYKADPVNGKDPAKNSLRDLTNKNVTDNTVATVGDIRNMGWIVSSDKTTGANGEYSEAVKNANEVRFVGEGSAIVSGKTEGNVRTITVKVDNQTGINKTVTPVNYTKADGTKVYPQEVDNGDGTKTVKFFENPDGTGKEIPSTEVNTSVNGPKGTTTPATLSNIKSNLPDTKNSDTTNTATDPSNATTSKVAPNTTNKTGDSYINPNNAATVSDVLNAGWNLQGNGTAVDFVKPYDTVNFVNGLNTTAVVSTVDGKTSNVTYNVTGLPVTYTTADGTPVTKIGDKYYKVNDQGQPVDGNGAPVTKFNKDGKPVDANGQEVPDVNITDKPLKTSLVNPTPENNKTGTTSPTSLSNVKNNIPTVNDEDKTAHKVDGTAIGGKNNTEAPITAGDAANLLKPTVNGAANPNFVGNNAATVSDVLNVGWNLQNNGTAKDFVKPYDTVNFVNGGNTTAVVTTNAEGTASDVTFNVTGLPITNTITDNGKEVPVVKVGDTFYPAKPDGTPDIQKGQDGNPTNGYVQANDGKVYPRDAVTITKNQDGTTTVTPNTDATPKTVNTNLVNPNVANTTDKPGNNVNTPNQLGNVANGAKTFDSVAADGTMANDAKPAVKLANDGKWYPADKVEANGKPKDGATPVANPLAPKNAAGDVLEKGNDGKWYKANELTNGIPNPTATAQTPEARPANSEKSGLINFTESNPNNAATIGDLQNMGWVVSAEGNSYSDQVRNANEVKFVGEGTATVTGKTDDKGIRTITVKVDDQTSTNNAVTPVVYTDKDGKQVYPTGKTDKDGNQIFNTQPDGKGNTVTGPVKTTVNGPKGTNSPTSLSNVKNNIPAVNDENKTITDADGKAKPDAGNVENINKAPLTAEEAADLLKPTTKDGKPNPNFVGNNAATVSDVLNAGWNLQNNGAAKDFVKPYDTVNFVNGGNTTAVVTTNAEGTVSDVTFNVTGLPVTYTTEDGAPVSKVGDKYYKVNDKGQPISDAGKPAVGKNNDGKLVDENNNVIEPVDTTKPLKTALVNPTPAGDKPNTTTATQLGNVTSGLDKYGDQVNNADVPGTTDKNRGLVDLSKPANADPKVSDNTAATVGDLRNMGWIVSSNKTTGENGAVTTDEYSATVKNANEVKFVGEGTAVVSGKTDDQGVRTITVKVDDQTSTNNAVTPVVYTDKDGKQVYPTGKTDKDGNQIFNTKPDGKGEDVTGPVKTTINGPKGTTSPTSLSNVKNNIPNVNDGSKTITNPDGTEKQGDIANINKAPLTAEEAAALANPKTKDGQINPKYIGNNAATVSDVLNAGWNLQNNGTAKDFVKPYDTVNFVNGGNTTAVVTTNAEGTASDVTFNVTGLPITNTITDNGKEVPVVKVGDTFYPAKPDGTPDIQKGQDGNPTNGYVQANDGKVYPRDAVTITKNQDGTTTVTPNTDATPKTVNTNLVNPNVANTTDKPGNNVNTPNQLGNVANGAKTFDSVAADGTMANDAKPAVKLANDGKWYPADKVEANGKPKDGATPVANPLAPKNAAGDVLEKGNDGKWYKANELTNGIPNPTATAQTPEARPANSEKSGLINFTESNPNNAATIGDLQNMGWVVSAEGNSYSDQVRNANEVKFVGEGTATVTGKTDDKGIRTITVKVDDQTSTNNAVTPVVYTDKDGKQVYPTGKTDKDGNQIFNTQPDGKGNTVTGPVKTTVNGPKGTNSPTSLSNVKNNIPAVNDENKTITDADGKAKPDAGNVENINKAPLTAEEAADLLKPTTKDGKANPNFVGNNAATVSDVLNAGWNLQNNGTAKDFVKPYDTVNFVNGGNTTAVVTTNAEGTASDVTFNVTGLPIATTIATPNGPVQLTKVGDNYYPVNADGTPNIQKDGDNNPTNGYVKADNGNYYPAGDVTFGKDPVTNATTVTPKDGKQPVTFGNSLTNPNVVNTANEPNKAVAAPTTLNNVKNNIPTVDDKKKQAFNPDGTEVTEPNTTTNTGNVKAPITATDAQDLNTPYKVDDKGNYLDVNGNITTDPAQRVANPKYIGNNAATVSDVLNAGWNLQGNGTNVDFVKPYDTVNFRNGGNTTVSVTTDDNLTSHVQVNVTGLPVSNTITDPTTGKQVPVVKVGDSFYPVNPDGTPKIERGQDGNPTNGYVRANDGKLYPRESVTTTPNQDGSTTVTPNTDAKPITVNTNLANPNVANTTDNPGNNVNTPSQLGNVANGAKTFDPVAADGTKLVQVGDKFYPADKVVNGVLKPDATEADAKDPVKLANDGKWYPADKVEANGKPKDSATAVENPLAPKNAAGEPLVQAKDGKWYKPADLQPNGRPTPTAQPQDNAINNKAGLVDFSNSNPNNAATIGDLQNMGWVVSAQGNSYSDQVRNANEVKFVGEGTAIVTGKTDDKGVRTITVKVDDQVTTNNSVTPVVYTDKNGNTVYPIKDDKGNVTYHTTPDGKGENDKVVPNGDVNTSINGPKDDQGNTRPASLSNVKNNIPAVSDADKKVTNPDGKDKPNAGDVANINKAPLTAEEAADLLKPTTKDGKPNANFVGNNAATVSDVLNAGWNLQNNGAAKDFVKPYDTVNFVNGLNTTAVVTTSEDGTTSNVTYNVTGLPVTYTTADGTPVTKIGDKYYKVNDQGQPVDGNGAPVTKFNKDGKPVDANGQEVPDVNITDKPLKTSLVNPTPENNKTGTTSPTSLSNVKNNIPAVNDTDKKVTNPDGTDRPNAGDVANINKAPLTAKEAADLLKPMKDGVANPNFAGNNAATVSDVLNAGWNLQGNGTNVDFVKPYDTVNFRNGGNTTVSVTTDDNLTSHVQVNVTGLPVSNTIIDPTTGKQVPVVKVGDAFYRTNPDGTPNIERDKAGNPTNGYVRANDGKLYPRDAVEVTPNATDPKQPPTITPKAGATPTTVNTNLVNPNVDNTTDNPGNNVNTPNQLGNVANGANTFNAVDAGGKDYVKANNGKYYEPSKVNADGSLKEGTNATADAKNPLVLANDGKWYPADKVSDKGTPEAGAKSVENPLAPKNAAGQPLVQAKDGKWYIPTDVQPNGLPTPTAQPQDNAINNKAGLVNFANSNPNNAATVGDLQNMGWVVSAPGNSYSEQVRNANEVKFVGEGTAIVTGKTDDKGVRTITVKVDDQVSTNNAIMPTNFTTADGTKVYPVKDDAGNVTYHTTPDGKGTGDMTIDPKNVVTSVNGPKGTTTPTTLKNVKNNIPNVNDGSKTVTTPDGKEKVGDVENINTAPLTAEEAAKLSNPKTADGAANPNYIGNNAATVSDVLSAGWNLQNNGTAKDFVKPYDTVNFINGLGTTAVVTTREGNTTSDVTFNVKPANSSVTVDEDGVKVTTGEITSNPNGSVAGPTTPDNAKTLKDALDAAVKELATAKDALKTAETALAANPKDPALQKAVEDKKAEVAAKQTPVNKAQKAHDDAGLSKIATVQNVADAINNSGFNLKTSADGGEKLTGTKDDGELIKPSNTVEMVAGKNLTVKQDANGKITYATKDDVTFTNVDTGTLNVGSPNTYTDGKGNTYTKVGDKYYKPADVVNGAPKQGATPVDVTTTPVTPVSPVTMKTEAAKPATNNATDAQPSSALNITSKDGKPTQITGVGSTLNINKVETTPEGTTPKPGTAPDTKPKTEDAHLVDLNGTADAPVNKNAAATVGDLQNMGWVVSAKDGNGYKDVVKNANVVDFKGGNGIEITGNTLADGTREITVGIKEGEVTNKVTITHGDGTKTDAVKIGDNYYKVDKDGKPVGFDKDENGKPAGTPLKVDPKTDKVTNAGAGFVTGNTVANAIQDSGWNVGIGSTYKDFSKAEKVYDKVNPSDDVKFTNGANTNVSMVTVDALNEDGTKKATTFVKVDVNRDLKIDSVTTGGTATDKNGNNLVKVGDKYYKEGDVTVVTNPDGTTTVTPKENAKAVPPADVIPAKDGAMIVKNADGKDVVSATVGKDGNGAFGINGKDGKNGISMTAKDGQGTIGVNGKDGKSTTIAGDTITIKDKDNNATNIGVNTITLVDKAGNTTTTTADKSEIKDAAGNINTNTATGNTLKDPNGNTHTSTASTSELKDKDGNTNTSTPTTNVLKDTNGNTNTSAATGTTYKDKDENKTVVGPKEINISDKSGENTASLTNKDLLLNAKDPNTGVDKTSHVSGDKIAFSTTDEMEKVVDKDGKPVIDPATGKQKEVVKMEKVFDKDGKPVIDPVTGKQKEVVKNPGNSTEYTNEGLRVVPNSTVARDVNGNPTFLDKNGKPVMKDIDGKYKYVGQDGKPGEKYTDAVGSLKPNVVDNTRVISFGMDKPVLDKNGKPVTDPDGNPVMTEGISAGMQQMHNLAPGTKDTDAVNVSQLRGTTININNRMNRMGAQAAALAGLQSIQYDPLEPTQISAGLGYYKGASALALGINHYKNESTMFHMGASLNGRGDETMMNASVTWKFGARADETAVKDTFRQGPISSAYTLQDKVSALEAQNKIQKDQLNELRATNAAQKAENEAQREELALMKAQIAELFKRMNG